MLCPYCGKEMRKGYIQAASHIIFSEKKTPVKALSEQCSGYTNR